MAQDKHSTKDKKNKDDKKLTATTEQSNTLNVTSDADLALISESAALKSSPAHHAKSSEDTIKDLATSSSDGLTVEESQARLIKFGANQLQDAKKKSPFLKFMAQFKDLMIIVLIIAAVVSAAIAIVQKEYAELIDGGIILLIVLINAIVGFVQENKAEAALDALRNMSKPFCKVVRGGIIQQIKSEELVVGDIVKLEAGDIVPADLRLFESASLKVQESALTGESVPSEKDCSAGIATDAPLGDRKNMAYSSGSVTYGNGKGVVVATGMKTEVGKIATMLSASEPQTTPLQKQLAKTAKLLSIIVLAVAAIIFIVAAVRKEPLVDAFMTSVAIAVAGIPEGLPAVVTIVLAIGVQKMSKHKAIIRNLPTVETLGCCEIICSDKTGTLTLNQMTVKKLYAPHSGVVNGDELKTTQEYDMLIRTMMLCNDSNQAADSLVGDPTETALVYYGEKLGYKFSDIKAQWNRIDEIPFDSIRKTMSTVNQSGDTKVAYIKGATDIILGNCKFIREGEKVRPITASDKTAVLSANLAMAKTALRVLCLAIKTDKLSDKENLEHDLTFVGLVGMIDPPRPEVKAAVKKCRLAGIRPIMITGDHKDTACAIASDIGIMQEGDKVMLGSEIDTLSDESFRSIITEYSVFARVSPENKVRIVQAYKSFNKVVAMTGDGVNDAPSIKEADIGIGMGITGTDVSKGAADMILTDDNFATIVGAVEEGRKIFTNIKKTIVFLLSANTAEVLCLFIASVFLNVGFLTPVMILWVNLVTDSLPALSLGMEKSEGEVMLEPPRKTNSSLFAGRTGADIIIQGLMQCGLVMLAFCIGSYVLADGVANHQVAMTMAFLTLCLIQLFHSFNLKSQTNSIIHKTVFSNKWLNLSFIAGALLIIVTILVPFMRPLFGTTALTGSEWGISIACAVAIVPLVETQKLIEKVFKKIKSKKNKK